MFLLIFIGDFKIYVLPPFQTPAGALSTAGSAGGGVRSSGRPQPSPLRAPPGAGPALPRPGLPAGAAGAVNGT